jgi:uncharacterized protein
MRIGDFLAARPLTGALLFEGSLLVLALVLALLLGLAPWQALHWSWSALGISAAATVPPLLLMWLLLDSGIGWVRELERLTHRTLDVILRTRPSGAIAALALLAGFGEEFLFRGVIQAGLVEPLGAAGAIGVASVLFGLAHAVTRAYFVAATVIGLYLGWLYAATGNLLIVCLVHALYDWLGIHYYLRRRTSGA